MTGEADLERIAAEARYARDRHDLYKARLYSGRPTSDARLRQLAQAREAAEARLAAARARARPSV